MPPPAPPAPRFRRRLIGAFVVVAILTGGVMAVTSYLLVREHRHASFASQAEEEARLSLLSVPPQLTLPGFEALVAEYQERGGFETVAVAEGVLFSSTPDITASDVPTETLGAGDLASTDLEVAGEPYLVIGARPTDSAARLYFFFPKADLLGGVAEFGWVLVIGWVVAVVVAAGFGERVARRTLRPVRAASEASQSLAEGLLDTRLEQPSDDEFGAWATSFNRMAEALQAKLEELAAATARERRFTSDVAHELRTPLTGMASAASLLKSELEAVQPPARRPAELLIEDVRRLRDLVGELLELSRHDAGAEKVELEPVHVGQAMAVVLRSWDGGSSIPARVAGDLWVMADKARFKRVLSNLVANAMHHGGGDVTVAARADGAQVVVDVLDRGPGLDPEDLSRVFDRFFKADAARSGGGSGLGLAIAMANARLQGGVVEAANREGGGARFSLRLQGCPSP